MLVLPPGSAGASSAPTAAMPPARPSACHSKMAATGDLRVQLARARSGTAAKLPAAMTASSAASASPLIYIPAEFLKRVPKRLSLGARYGPGEPGECRGAIARLVQCGQHKFRYVCFTRRSRTIAPRTPVALPSGESLLGEPVEDGHDRGVRKVAFGQPSTDLTDGKRTLGLPEDVHDRALKFA